MGDCTVDGIRQRQKHILQYSRRRLSFYKYLQTHYVTLGNQRQFLIRIARQMALKEHEGKTIMYVAMGSEWRQFGHARKRRPLDSVILDTGISERIVNDCQEFINNPSWYSERGIELQISNFYFLS